MKTVTEETGSEIGYSDDGSSGTPPRVPKTQPRPIPRSIQLESTPMHPRDGRDRHLVWLEPSRESPERAMDHRGWRRPSAPSILNHLESVLGRRPSGSIPITVMPASGPPIPAAAMSGSRPSSLRHAAPPLAATPSNVVASRRPSAIVLMTHSTSPDEERRLMGPTNLERDESSTSFTPLNFDSDEYLKVSPKFHDTITVYLSAMYAKLLVTLGIAFPILETLHDDSKYYQGFYLYLYIGTFCFLTFMYGNVLRTRAVLFVVNTYRRKGSQPRPSMVSVDIRGHHGSAKHFGSFYLRLGAIAFGIGSMIYSGLEFGQYFELRPDCRRITQALTPGARMVLTLVQMQFIFLNNRQTDILRHKVVAQFGLMHMVATNLCEWLTVIIEEAKHEIEHMPTNDNHTAGHGRAQHRSSRSTSHDVEDGVGHGGDGCVSSDIIGTLIRNASPFLFPCTIEYSLICAVVLFEMWKTAHRYHGDLSDLGDPGHDRHATHHNGLLDLRGRSAHLLSVDCTKAHKGLFAGIVVVVLTIICLILFFVLNEAPGFKAMAMRVVSWCELSLYIVTTLAVWGAFYQIRSLKYPNKGRGLGLDNTLLIMAQTGVFLYNLFSIMAYSSDGRRPRVLVSELIALVQTICQTIFVLDATGRRCCSPREYRRKPGRQIVTFLLVANMAMWIVNTLEKSRARSRPTMLDFYGIWPWTLIVHISMPLAIFYRFHSTICLFEIWKGCYKLKHLTVRKHADSEQSATG